jgi:AbrB family looped-hinge helix DNA binding protein
MSVVTVDSKGRILLPREVRETMQVEPGDVLFLTQDGRFVTLAKADNPFDRLAAHAIAEYYAGETISLEEALEAVDEDDVE